MAVDVAVPLGGDFRDHLTGPGEIRPVAEALAELGTALAGAVDRDTILRVAARHLCEIVGASRCSVYMHDGSPGLFRGVLAHADRNIDSVIRRLTCGIEADAFTRELVRTRAPGVVADASRDPRVVRSTMRAFGIRSMLGVPMVLRGRVQGIFFVDSEGEHRGFSTAEQELAAAFVELVAAAISQCERAAELQSRHRAIVRQHRAFREVAAIDSRLARVLVLGGGLPAIATAVAEMTKKPCAICDENLDLLAVAGAGGGASLRAALASADAATAAAGLGDDGPVVLGPFPSVRGSRLLIAPVTGDGERWANLAIAEAGGSFGAVDALIARRAANFVAFEISAERRAAGSERDARAALGADLIRGRRDVADLERRAAFLGMPLDGWHAVCLIGAVAGEDLDFPSPEELLAALGDEREGRAIASETDEGIALVVRLDDDIEPSRAVSELELEVEAACLSLEGGGRLIAAFAEPCDLPVGGPAAYRQALDAMSCVAASRPAFPAARCTVTAAELGPGRVLLAGADPARLDRVVHEALGALLKGGPRLELLSTLDTYFANDRSVRLTAVGLKVHQNTVRYRLSRIEELTGLRVQSSADDQLTAQISLLILRLQGAIPSGRQELAGATRP